MKQQSNVDQNLQTEQEAIVLPPWFLWHFSLRPELAASQAPRKLTAASFLNLLQRFARSFHLSHSQVEQMCKMAKDLADWRETEHLKGFLRQQLETLSTEENIGRAETKAVLAQRKSQPQQRKKAFTDFEAFYREKQNLLPNFQVTAPRPKVPKYHFEVLQEAETERSDNTGDRILGRCPVASVKTSCCNLLTLDAIQQCGFGCSYCAIQHFYDERNIQVRGNFAQKLQELKLDPEQWYHIGTGQASDSLLWSEELGVLRPLIDFAQRYPRVILELKSKSANVQNLLQQDLPPNMLFTWSLNPDSVIRHEELLSAPLDARLRSARQLADRGAKVGFHFHPILRYQGWKSEYRDLCQRLAALFRPEEVVTVSLGTLTFSRSALKNIRQKAENTQILRFPMQEIAGKFSYSYEIKCEMFRHVYQALHPWHGQLFFYLCMEDPALWPEVFGRQYSSNQEFEQDMLHSYARKMGLA